MRSNPQIPLLGIVSGFVSFSEEEAKRKGELDRYIHNVYCRSTNKKKSLGRK